MKTPQKGIISKVINFVTKDIWSINSKKVASSKQLFFIRLARVIILAFRGFNEDKCIDKASALTYYTLLALVPLVAMAFGIAKGFGFETMFEDFLYDKLSDRQELVEQILSFSSSMLSNTKGGVIAGIGILVLLWSVIKILGRIETSFNEIWSVNKHRTFVRKISDYLTIMLLAPIFFIISNSATAYVSIYVTELAAHSQLVSSMYGLISIALNILPYSLIWFTFAFLYIVMPNTKVSFGSAILGGIIAGIVFQITQYFYITFQVGVSSYNAIYGSFAAIPLFLIWMQLSWIIVLLGAEIAYATQNVKNFEYEVETKQMSNSLKMKLSLWILHHIIMNFERGELPPNAGTLSESLDIPHRITKLILNILLDAQLILETKTVDEKSYAYTPALCTDSLSIAFCMDKINTTGINTIDLTNAPCFDTISETLDAHTSEEQVLLKHLAL